MYLNGYSVNIVGGSEKTSGYVELQHKSTYKIQLRNSNNTRCDAKVSIDGKEIGTFRISANSNMTLERPVDEAKKFTFYKVNSKEGKKVNEGIDKQDEGLIEVVFSPEKQAVYYINPYPIKYWTNTWPHRDYQYTWGTGTNKDSLFSVTTSLSNSGEYVTQECIAQRSAGVTGLTGHSDQNFINVGSIEYDDEKITCINLRLVAVEKERADPTPLRPIMRSTPIPPPVAS